MALDIETVTTIVRNYANDVRQIMPVDKVILYGSHAKAKATKKSDIDVCFFLNSFGTKNRIDIMSILIGISLKYMDVDIEPVAFEVSELQDDNYFIKEVLRTGIEIR
jgi:predicted nucleotidyltransferase